MSNDRLMAPMWVQHPGLDTLWEAARQWHDSEAKARKALEVMVRAARNAHDSGPWTYETLAELVEMSKSQLVKLVKEDREAQPGLF